jgi:catechol 2,3-dioxygenase-like lactoylglutathione lyase family enzyme
VDDMTLPLGAFHELSLSTRDLAASVAFWKAAGWMACAVRPVWPHPYAALSNGSIVVGLHEYRFPSPSVTCIHPGIAAALEAHRDAGMAIAFAKTGPDCFNEFGFRDPHGHMVTLLEGPTHDGPPRDAALREGTGSASATEVFLSLSADDVGLGMRFWGVLGAAERGASPEGWPCRRFEAGGSSLALHAASLHKGVAIVRCGHDGSRTTGTGLRVSPEGLAVVTLGA